MGHASPIRVCIRKKVKNKTKKRIEHGGKKTMKGGALSRDFPAPTLGKESSKTLNTIRTRMGGDLETKKGGGKKV